MSAVKYFWPTNKLFALMTAPGGKTRSEALADARAELAECSGLADEGVARALDSIDAVLADAKGGSLTREQVYTIMQATERLAGIATMFDMPLMLRVTASMGELGMALLDAPSRPFHHVAVHARAARWAADNVKMSEAEAEPVLAGLLKVAGKLGPAPLAAAS